jgi:hypothetical protein
MASEIQPWRPSTTLSLEQRVQKSRMTVQCATSPREALEAGKRLIGQWPHAKPSDPETYAASLAAVLALYPLGLVQECCDPRTGLALVREFPPTVACLVEWLDKRLAWHQAVASHVNRPRVQYVEPNMTAGALAKGKAAWAGLLKTLTNRGDLRALTFDKAAEIGSNMKEST